MSKAISKAAVYYLLNINGKGSGLFGSSLEAVKVALSPDPTEQARKAVPGFDDLPKETQEGIIDALPDKVDMEKARSVRKLVNDSANSMTGNVGQTVEGEGFDITPLKVIKRTRS